MRDLELIDCSDKTVKLLRLYNTSGEGNNCLLNALFGDLSEESAITIENEEKTKEMRQEIREFLKSGYKLLEENESIKGSIISGSYESLHHCLEGSQKVEDLVNDGEQLLCNLIPIIMFLSGIEKVTLYIVNNDSAELHDIEKANKQEYTLHSSVFNQVNKKEEVWGNSNAKEYTLFLHSGHYSRAKVINQKKLVSVGDASTGSATRNNQLVANKGSKRVSNTQGNNEHHSYLVQNNPTPRNAKSKLPVIAASMLAITGVVNPICLS